MKIITVTHTEETMETTDHPPLCRDCKWYMRDASTGYSALCLCPQNETKPAEVDLVHGYQTRPEYHRVLCSLHRKKRVDTRERMMSVVLRPLWSDKYVTDEDIKHLCGSNARFFDRKPKEGE